MNWASFSIIVFVESLSVLESEKMIHIKLDPVVIVDSTSSYALCIKTMADFMLLNLIS